MLKRANCLAVTVKMGKTKFQNPRSDRSRSDAAIGLAATVGGLCQIDVGAGTEGVSDFPRNYRLYLSGQCERGERQFFYSIARPPRLPPQKPSHTVYPPEAPSTGCRIPRTRDDRFFKISAKEKLPSISKKAVAVRFATRSMYGVRINFWQVVTLFAAELSPV
jgi:hypothetical protein